MTINLFAYAHDPRVQLGALAVALVLATLVAWKVRKVARSERPDEPLSNLVMVVGLGWSSEAAWILTGRAHFPISLRLLLFFVLEAILGLAMIRAKRSMRLHGHPGRSGRTAWIVATGMSLVAVGVAHSFAEGVLRLIVPLLITNAWWDGLVGDSKRKDVGRSSWRWTPRRLMLALGAIEPGERDIETVHRERLTQQMTKLFFKVQHGSKRLKEQRKARLMRLSLAADDGITAEVMTRVDRASWFEATQPAALASPPAPVIPAAAAASARARRVRHGRSLRRVIATHPRPVIVTAQEPEPDPRSTQEIDDAARVMKSGDTALSGRRIAFLLRASEPTVRRALRRTQNPAPPPTVNGRKPELESANR